MHARRDYEKKTIDSIGYRFKYSIWNDGTGTSLFYTV